MRAVLAVFVLGVVVAAAWPGGWAVITVEDLPTHFEQGESVDLAFTVRQHGVHPTPGLSPVVRARVKGADLSVPARAAGPSGRYVASIVLPHAGDAELTIRSGFNDATEVRLIPMQAIPRGAAAPVVPARELGRRLFVAKGCMSCHTHADVRPTNHVGGAPELTERRYTADYLRRLLTDPDAVLKYSTTMRMPKLELKSHEIDAVTAFINAER